MRTERNRLELENYLCKVIITRIIIITEKEKGHERKLVERVESQELSNKIEKCILRRHFPGWPAKSRTVLLKVWSLDLHARH